MQIIGGQNVRVVPDVSVSGNGTGAGLTEALLGMLLKNQLSDGKSEENPKPKK